MVGGVPSMFDSSEVKVRSVERTYEPMYRNRIRGIRCRASWPLTEKPRRRLRSVIWKQWKRNPVRFAELRKRGVGKPVRRVV